MKYHKIYLYTSMSRWEKKQMYIFHPFQSKKKEKKSVNNNEYKVIAK